MIERMTHKSETKNCNLNLKPCHRIKSLLVVTVTTQNRHLNKTRNDKGCLRQLLFEPMLISK